MNSFRNPQNMTEDEKQLQKRPTDPIMDEVREVITELADEIEAEVEARRGAVLPRTTERDLAPVRRARALLAKLEGHGG